MKRIRTIAVGVIALAAGVAAILHRPSMLVHWSQLRPGMPRNDVLTIVGNETADLRSEKGFETVGSETRMAGMSAYWQLFLHYDASNRLTGADARFVNRDCGIFSTNQRSIFQ